MSLLHFLYVPQNVPKMFVEEYFGRIQTRKVFLIANIISRSQLGYIYLLDIDKKVGQIIDPKFKNVLHTGCLAER